MDKQHKQMKDRMLKIDECTTKQTNGAKIDKNGPNSQKLTKKTKTDKKDKNR